jgi:hypothetical protein
MSYGRRVLDLLERNPEAFMLANRDGDGHVVGVYFHPDFLMGVTEIDLRMAIITMPPHPRKVWLAVEVGYVTDARVADGRVYPTERIGEPMTIEECMDWYGYMRSTVETHLSTARRHLESRMSSPPKDGVGALLRKVRRGS